MSMYAALGHSELTEREILRKARRGPAIADGPWRPVLRSGVVGSRRPASPLEALDALQAAQLSLDTARAAAARVAADRFEEIDVRLEPETATYWCGMRPQGRPSYTPALLRGLADMQRSMVRLFDETPAGAEPPFRYFVVRSLNEGVFNLGGDLSLFSHYIRAGDRAALSDYAIACIDVVYANYVDYGLPIVTIGLVQGDALGGGFEAALSCDVLVAERGAKFGFPEVLFNLFPGMGAFSFLARRLPGNVAREIIASGRIYDAEELAGMGLVDILAEPGEGEAAVRAYITRNRRRHNAHAAMFAAMRRAQPAPYEELAEIVDLWVDAAMQLEPGDLRKMERLVAAQNKRGLQPAAE